MSSRFFRSPNELSDVTDSQDVTEAEDSTAGAIENRDEELSSSHAPIKFKTTESPANSSDPIESSRQLARNRHDVNDAAIPPANNQARRHQDFVTHALLKRLAVHEAVDYFRENTGGDPSYKKDHPAVEALAAEQYQHMTTMLSNANMVADLRNRSAQLLDAYSKGLDRVSSTGPLSGRLSLASGSPDLPSLNTATQTLSLASSNAQAGNQLLQHQVQQMLHRQRCLANLPLSLQSLVDHPLYEPSRYLREFIEMGLIGEGGYGRVYHVKHKLDQSDYAVKKIKLNSTRIKKIREDSQAELDTLLREILTLAKFHHPNIVRYHAGWLEYTQPSQVSFSPSASPFQSRHLLNGPKSETTSDQESSAAVTKSKESVSSSIGMANSASIGRAETVQNSSDINVVFEHKGGKILGEETTTPISEVDHTAPKLQVSNFGARPRHGSSASETASVRSKRSTVHSIGDDQDPLGTVLESTHHDSNSIDSALTSLGPSIERQRNASVDPELFLHIQMSLYPLSLAQYLSTSRNFSVSQEVRDCRHCFHPHMSLQILLAILDGVQYLHNCGVVHRDLKPSNIFLSLDRWHSPACVDLSRCSECSHGATNQSGFLKVCIGDFGLVAEIAKPDVQPHISPSKAVGTELYRPINTPVHVDEKLDMFSLGIIATELLLPFDTQMERRQKLQDLRTGKLSDHDFVARLGGVGRDVHDCLKLMTSIDEERRPTCKEVRERIERLCR